MFLSPITFQLILFSLQTDDAQRAYVTYRYISGEMTSGTLRRRNEVDWTQNNKSVRSKNTALLTHSEEERASYVLLSKTVYVSLTRRKQIGYTATVQAWVSVSSEMWWVQRHQSLTPGWWLWLSWLSLCSDGWIPAPTVHMSKWAWHWTLDTIVVHCCVIGLFNMGCL